mgnify:CR=1 FL=1
MSALDVTFLNNVTREHFVEGLRNQLYDEMPMLKMIVNNGVEDAVGRSLIWDVVLARNQANGQVAGYDEMVTQEANLVTQASLSWADYYYANVSISQTELSRNSGTKEKLVSMLETKMAAAKSTLKEKVYADLWLALTARGSYATIVGFAAVCDLDNTYAGILRTTAGNEGWQSNTYEVAVTADEAKDPTSGAKYLPTLMRTQLKNTSHDGMATVIVTTPTIYEIYEFIAETHNLRFGNGGVDLGFNSAKMTSQTSKNAGKTATVYWDKYATASKIYYLNPDTWKSFIFPGANFEPADVLGTGIWQRGSKQLAAYMTIVWSGQVLCLVPRENAVATNVAAT